jgi:hypothetical protein
MHGQLVIDDLVGADELDEDAQAYETALWEGGWDDGTTFGFHVEDREKERDLYDEEEEDEDDL